VPPSALKLNLGNLSGEKEKINLILKRKGSGIECN